MLRFHLGVIIDEMLAWKYDQMLKKRLDLKVKMGNKLDMDGWR